MHRWLLPLFPLSLACLAAPVAMAQTDPAAPVDEPPADVVGTGAASDVADEGGLWRTLGLEQRAATATHVRSFGIDMSWALWRAAPLGGGFTFEHRFTEHLWGTATASVSFSQLLPLGARINTNNSPAETASSIGARPGLRYVVNPGSPVELFGGAGLLAGASASLNKRDVAFWEVLGGNNDPSLIAATSVTLGGWTTVGAELAVLDALRLRFATDIAHAAVNVSNAGFGDFDLVDFLTDSMLVSTWAQLAVSPSVSLHLRF
jgi:hypothetical protein